MPATILGRLSRFTLAKWGSDMSGFSGAPSPIKAWVNFNGTGVLAVNASVGISSVVDTTTGRYLVNFMTPFPNINYAPIVTSGNPFSASDERSHLYYTTKTTEEFQVDIVNINGANVDREDVSIVFLAL